MDRRQKIMRLIIEILTEQEHLNYECNGAVTVMDPNLVSLDFVVKKPPIRGEFNVRGLIDMPLSLQAQYDSSSSLHGHSAIQKQIEKDLQMVSDKINRLL